jgi:hypothetical protein
MASISVQNLEDLLHAKRLGGTLGRLHLAPRLTSTGLAALDRKLGGGWRRGALSELVGSRSSGRTSLMLHTLTEATREGQVVALVDALDRFDPRVAEAWGIRLEAMLWVRGAPITVEMAQPALIDRVIKQAVRAGDLILRAGGFGVVVIDLADVPPRRVQALPAITWLRLAHTAEGQDTVCLLIGGSPMGRSALGVSVEVTARPVWTGTSAQSRRLSGFTPAFDVRAARRVPMVGLEPASTTPLRVRA